MILKQGNYRIRNDTANKILSSQYLLDASTWNTVMSIKLGNRCSLEKELTAQE